MNRPVSWIRLGAISGALAVIFGAFGAHGIAPTEESLNAMSPPQRKIVERRLANYETAARYHLVHSLAIVAVGLAAMAAGSRPKRSLDLAGWSFLFGTVVFSGTLYAYGVGGPRWLGAITPIGGVGMILGWLLFAVAAPSRPMNE